jgi:hypothetical protein
MRRTKWLRRKSTLRGQLLLAALACSNGDPEATFSSEELLIAAWKHDPASWGLRGFEKEHPDSNRIHRELDSRGKDQKGIAGSGLLARVRPRTYRLTPKGLAAATAASEEDPQARERLNRVLEQEVTRIIEHPTFVRWLSDEKWPRSFRDVGHFWGVAPGTPPRVVRQRIQTVEDTLGEALALLERRHLEEVGDRQGRLLFDRTDVERALEFDREMKKRFEKELMLLTGAQS